jgi:hypothetical protein
MKTNKKVNQFKAKIGEIIDNQKKSICSLANAHLSSFDTIDFIIFDETNRYNGILKNKIFFTYCDHYRANSGTNMQIGELVHPNSLNEDRGYLKGVATDLDGYIKLRSANNLNHNIQVIASIYFPKFKKSLNSENYKLQCNDIVDNAIKEMNLFVANFKKLFNDRLFDLTNCSLLHYLRSI